VVSQNYHLYRLNYGLEDINEYNTVWINVVSVNQILISNFQTTSPDTEVSLTLRMVNPNSNGYTTPLKIISYKSSAQLIIIDSDLVTAKTSIIDYTSTSSSVLVGITATNPLANGAATDLLFSIKPGVTIPAGGYIKVRIPDDFQIIIPINVVNCELYDGTTWKTAQGCVSSGNVITIWTRTDLTFVLNILGKFRILAQVKTPVYNKFRIIKKFKRIIKFYFYFFIKIALFCLILRLMMSMVFEC